MSKTPAQDVARKFEQAEKNMAAARQKLVNAATGDVSSKYLADYVNELASAEGAYIFWARLNQAAKHTVDSGNEFTEQLASQIVISALVQGADDTWSGRTNDAKRAYFDGVRSAAEKVEYLF